MSSPFCILASGVSHERFGEETLSEYGKRRDEVHLLGDFHREKPYTILIRAGLYVAMGACNQKHDNYSHLPRQVL